MKKLGKIIVIILTGLFLWVLYIPINPIPSDGLKEKYYICDVGNLKLWKMPTPVQARIEFMEAIKFPTSTENNAIKFSYEDIRERPFFQCWGKISVYALYQAKTLNARIKINQPAEFAIALHRNSIQSGWLRKLKADEVNKPILISWSIEKVNQNGILKLNWLPGDFDGLAITVDKFDFRKPLMVTIYEIYLK